MTYNQEQEYLDLIDHIINSEESFTKKNRTGVDTIGIFGPQMVFDLREEIPVLTTKKVYWKGVVHELLWFISGNTNIEYLKRNNVNIWNANAEAYFKEIEEIKKNKQNYGYTWFENIKKDDLGPVYGHQWRNFNGGFGNNEDGFDQLKWAIDEIRTNPENRRIIVSAWNPLQMPMMALPPCHVMYHFLVNDKKELNIILYQRSCDLALGAPFNIASYSLFTYMIAHITGLKPGKFYYNLGDAHIYVNHIEPLKEQLKREPFPLPKLKLNDNVKEIDEFTYEDIELVGYKSHPSIKMDMAV